MQVRQTTRTPHPVSPTVFRELWFRFFFFSREETRVHLQVQGGRGEAKFCLEPEIEFGGELRIEKRQAFANSTTY